MTQEESVKIWLDGADDALDTADKLFENGKYHHALFFLHLALEKILKAIYAQNKSESPPPIHDLVRLAEKSNLKLGEKQNLQLAEISTFNVSARYDDYKLRFYKKATLEYSTEWRGIGKELFQIFESKLS